MKTEEWNGPGGPGEWGIPNNPQTRMIEKLLDLEQQIFAARLLCLMETHGVGVAEVATAVGLSEQCIQHYLDAEIRPAFINGIEKLAAYFGIKTEVLWTDLDNELGDFELGGAVL